MKITKKSPRAKTQRRNDIFREDSLQSSRRCAKFHYAERHKHALNVSLPSEPLFISLEAGRGLEKCQVMGQEYVKEHKFLLLKEGVIRNFSRAP